MNADDSLQTSPTLLARIEAKDPDAWTLFVQLYSPLVYSWCRNLGVAASDIADIQQEVFKVVSTKIQTYEAGRKANGGFRSWLWGITRLRILDFWRHAHRQPIGKGGDDEAMGQVPEAEPVGDDKMTSQQLLLNSAIAILEPTFDARTWRAFWDLAVKGRPTKDISEELQMSANAVRQAKFRVSRKLRELLNDDFTALFPQRSD